MESSYLRVKYVSVTRVLPFPFLFLYSWSGHLALDITYDRRWLDLGKEVGTSYLPPNPAFPLAHYTQSTPIAQSPIRGPTTTTQRHNQELASLSIHFPSLSLSLSPPFVCANVFLSPLLSRDIDSRYCESSTTPTLKDDENKGPEFHLITFRFARANFLGTLIPLKPKRATRNNTTQNYIRAQYCSPRSNRLHQSSLFLICDSYTGT
jgi:hypothetical protein